MGKSKSLIVNVVYNYFKTLFNLTFPVITFSYASRVLGAEGVGKVNFSKSYISYFTMIAILGMNYYGTREAAKLRDSKKKLSRFVQEMMIINGSTSIVAYLLLIITVLCIPQLQVYSELIFIFSFSIILTGMGMEWLYQALEEYKYITVRSIIFQVIALVVMFLYVKTREDIIWYAIVSVVASSGSNILNLFRSRKYIVWRKLEQYDIKKHIKPLLWLFALALSIELYTVLDSTMLGFLKGDSAVGIYTAAIKVNKIANSLITSLGVVLIPRLSYYVGGGRQEQFKILVNKAYNVVFLFSVPACLGLFVLSDEIILLFCGSGFETAGFTMRLLTPIVLVIPFSVVTNQQTFVPMGKEKLILISTCAGAGTNFMLNLLLIPGYSENGAALATVMAEMIVAIICFINMNRYLGINGVFHQYHQYWIAGLSILVIGICISRSGINYVATISLTITLSAICYFFMLLFMKNKCLLEMIKIIKEKTILAVRKK